MLKIGLLIDNTITYEQAEHIYTIVYDNGINEFNNVSIILRDGCMYYNTDENTENLTEKDITLYGKVEQNLLNDCTKDTETTEKIRKLHDILNRKYLVVKGIETFKDNQKLWRIAENIYNNRTGYVNKGIYLTKNGVEIQEINKTEHIGEILLNNLKEYVQEFTEDKKDSVLNIASRLTSERNHLTGLIQIENG